MIYDANKIEWEVGDVVVHDADAKQMYMLMIVVGKTRGRYRTRYLQPFRAASYHNAKDVRWLRAGKVVRAHYAQIWVNNGGVLHDPERFGIDIPDIADVDLSHCPELKSEEGIVRARTRA